MMGSSRKTKVRFAFVLLILAAIFLVMILITCFPDRSPSVDFQTHKQPSPSTPPREETASPGHPGGVPPAAPHEKQEENGLIAIIIDDAGYSLEDLEPFLSFEGPLAIAVLPNLPHSTEAARRVKAYGKELLLHIPMEPLNGENPGPGALRTDQSEEEIERLLRQAFASVPGSEGVNNHMGSKASADKWLMTEVLSFVKREGNYFVDSRTTPDTVAETVAAALRVPFLKRDVFMDNERDYADIDKSLEIGINDARARGSAVLIGHIQTPVILDALKKKMPVFQESKVRLVGLSEMLSRSDGAEIN
jgi:polysaccharide deacetylase 2 family uncharacterized protein YibQ